LGLWAAAEGLVYDGYDPAVHDLRDDWRAPPSWEIVWGLDFGFSNPTALTIWALDSDGRLYLTGEYYLTGTRVEILARMVKAEQLDLGYRPVAVLCDHDPENAATFEQYTGLSVTMADKQNRDDGIEACQGRFDLAEDGRPRVFFREGSLLHPPDSALADAGKPTGLRDELLGYVWNLTNPNRLKDEPLKVNDHALDSYRYVARWVDTHRSAAGESAYGGSQPAAPALWPKARW
jgi:hypothetical protein